MACDREEDEYEAEGGFLSESYKLAIKIALDDAKKRHKAQIIKMRQTLSRASIGSKEARAKREQGGTF